MGDGKVGGAARVMPRHDSTDEYPMLAWEPSLNKGDVALEGKPELPIATMRSSTTVDDVKVTYTGGKGSAMKHFAPDVATAFVLSVRPSVKDAAGSTVAQPKGTDLRGTLFDALVLKFYGVQTTHPAIADLRRRYLAQDPQATEQVVIVFPNVLRR